MDATIIHTAVCPVCGYRNTGYRFGRIRPGMRRLTVHAPSIVVLPRHCEECGHPVGLDYYEQGRSHLDAATSAAVDAWRVRQRQRREQRRAERQLERQTERTLNG